MNFFRDSFATATVIKHATTPNLHNPHPYPGDHSHLSSDLPAHSLFEQNTAFELFVEIVWRTFIYEIHLPF